MLSLFSKVGGMEYKLEELVRKYRELGIDQQMDYDKFYLYSIITHSTAIEGSTITELENQIMFDQGIFFEREESGRADDESGLEECA